MLCAEFEDRLTDYLDDALEVETQRAFAAHALRCPVCHELLNEVRNALVECRASTPPQPSPELEARIILRTAPETSMSCEQFEEHLTDYLDGFLPAPLYHRWERHAAICEKCTELPGHVVRAIGACYSYISEEKLVPVGLHERILQSTLGTTQAQQVRAPLPSRVAALLRDWLDAIVQPQLATVATMILMAVLVGTSTLSPDGSISGMYRATLRLAAQTATQAERVTDGLETLVGPSQNGGSTSKETAKPADAANQSKSEK
jgi:anti-sigma factor RsiW